MFEYTTILHIRTKAETETQRDKERECVWERGGGVVKYYERHCLCMCVVIVVVVIIINDDTLCLII